MRLLMKRFCISSPGFPSLGSAHHSSPLLAWLRATGSQKDLVCHLRIQWGQHHWPRDLYSRLGRAPQPSLQGVLAEHPHVVGGPTDDMAVFRSDDVVAGLGLVGALILNGADFRHEVMMD